MTYHTMKNKQRIREAIDFLISGFRRIALRVQGRDGVYYSRIIMANYGSDSSRIGERSELVIEKLTPEKGNSLIQSNSKAVVEFSLGDRTAEFDTEYIGSSDSRFSRLIISFPERIRLRERRGRDRGTEETPRFVSVRFTVDKGSEEEKTYELEIIDYSAIGVGILVTKKDFDLLKKIEVGEKIQEMTLYAKWTTVRVDGTVMHKTRIKDPQHKGSYILGVQLGEVLEGDKSV